MDAQYPFASRDDIWRVLEELKELQLIQYEQSERLTRLERRRDDDARLKSVWGHSALFPTVVGGSIATGKYLASSRCISRSWLITSLQNLLSVLPPTPSRGLTKGTITLWPTPQLASTERTSLDVEPHERIAYDLMRARIMDTMDRQIDQVRTCL